MPTVSHKLGALLLQPENQGAKENEVKNCPFSIHPASAFFHLNLSALFTNFWSFLMPLAAKSKNTGMAKESAAPRL